MLRTLRNFAVELWKDERGIAPLIGLGLKFGLPALSGLFGGGNKQRQESTQNVDLTDIFNRSSGGSTLPAFLQEAGPLSQEVLKAALENLNQPIEFDDNALDVLQRQQSGGVNEAFEGAGRNLAASLAARGLSNSPGAVTTGLANLEGARAGELGGIFSKIAQQRFNLPLIQQKLRTQKLQNALSTLGLFRGQNFTESSSGTNKRTGTTTNRGTAQGGPGRFGQGFQNLAQAISFNAGNTLPSGTNLGDLVEPGLPDISGEPLPQFP